ncbi:MAG: peptidylprolyl isomerase [Bacteroidales bacterium]|nr:peptidylprolyl isomerase [Bacteroidales bacterium]
MQKIFQERFFRFSGSWMVWLIMSAAPLAAQQPVLVDKIVAVVGKNQVLYSDVEDQYLQFKAQGLKPMPSKCVIFEDLLSQKLLVNQAAVDSITVDEMQVELELNERINYFVGQIGSEQKLIEYFGKSILEIKEDMRDAIRDQMLMQRMRSEITSDMSVTPQEVKNYFNSLPKDSIPYIDAVVEINQLVIKPTSSEQAVFDVREKLLNIRERIVNGENFATLAVLYSEGPSSPRGGDIGWSTKAQMDPDYWKAAYALKEGQVSKIVESSFGYHIIQLLEKSEDRIHTRHILMRPKVSLLEKQAAKSRLDSLVTLVRLDTMTFEEAALRFSTDEDTRAGGGLKVNPMTGKTAFEFDEFESKEYIIIRDMEVGEISKPFETTDEKGNAVYKVIRLKSKTEPHRANLKQDFELLKEMTSREKQDVIVDEWVQEKIESTYIRLEAPYDECKFRIKEWQK